MTLTLVSEAATRPKSPPAPPRYTPAEDATIAAMLAAGAKYSEIAAALGRAESGIKYRVYTMTNLRPQHGPAPRTAVANNHCQRCGVLLAVAPGTDNVCGWCVRETARKR